MAFLASELQLRLKDVRVSFSAGRTAMSAKCEIFHEPSGAIVFTAAEARSVANFARLTEADAMLQKQLNSHLLSSREWHSAKDALNGYSLYDASLVSERWEFTRENGTYTIEHPISGEFTGETIQTDPDGFLDLKSRLASIIRNVLPPSIWTFADSPSAGDLRAWCAAVSGAASYNVYDDQGTDNISLLGNVPDNTQNTLTVGAGLYNVRLAPVDGSGTVGILGNTVPVEVLAGGAQAFMVQVENPEEPTIEPEVEPKKKSNWRKLLEKIRPR